jgi:hypothetical protein
MSLLRHGAAREVQTGLRFLPPEKHRRSFTARDLGGLLALLLVFAAPAMARGPGRPDLFAQTAAFPLNKSVTSSVGQGISIVLTPNQNTQNVRVYDFSVRCSAGTATLTISDGATVIRAYPNQITSSFRIGTFTVPLIATRGNTMTLALTSCGPSATGTLTVRADSY